MGRKSRRFTLLEILIVIMVLALLASALLPILSRARKQARYARWLGYKNNMRSDPDAVIVYDFQEGEGDRLHNLAVGPEGHQTYVPETYHASIHGATWATGRYPHKGALYFDGDDYALVDRLQPHLPRTNKSQTIVWWFKPEGTAGVQNVVDLRTAQGGAAIQTGIRNQVVNVWKSGGASLVAAPESPDSSRWSMACYTLTAEDDGNCTHRLYINRDLVATSSTAPQDGQPDLISIGRFSAGSEYFTGLIDELMVFQRAFTPEDVVQHYDMGNP